MNSKIIILVMGCLIISCNNKPKQVSVGSSISGIWNLDSFVRTSENINKIEDLLLTTVDYSGMIFKFSEEKLQIYSPLMELEEQEIIQFIGDDSILIGESKALFLVSENKLILTFKEGNYYLSKSLNTP
jgi:hypothetical protein